ncbi:hypothetical protein LTR85_008189 [Meristemomyces frigidus]|nr:hypothetical protein LTR85_008189 [Meristemomyces frigidus]
MAYNPQIQCTSCGKAYTKILRDDLGNEFDDCNASKLLASPTMVQGMMKKHICFSSGVAAAQPSVAALLTTGPAAAAEAQAALIHSKPAAKKSERKSESRAPDGTKRVHRSKAEIQRKKERGDIQLISAGLGNVDHAGGFHLGQQAGMTKEARAFRTTGSRLKQSNARSAKNQQRAELRGLSSKKVGEYLGNEPPMMDLSSQQATTTGGGRAVLYGAAPSAEQTRDGGTSRTLDTQSLSSGSHQTPAGADGVGRYSGFGLAPQYGNSALATPMGAQNFASGYQRMPSAPAGYTDCYGVFWPAIPQYGNASVAATIHAQSPLYGSHQTLPLPGGGAGSYGTFVPPHQYGDGSTPASNVFGDLSAMSTGLIGMNGFGLRGLGTVGDSSTTGGWPNANDHFGEGIADAEQTGGQSAGGQLGFLNGTGNDEFDQNLYSALTQANASGAVGGPSAADSSMDPGQGDGDDFLEFVHGGYVLE